jgi:hypothetical protein
MSDTKKEKNESEQSKSGIGTLILTLLSAAVVGLGGFWFGSIASDKDVQRIESRQNAFEHEVKTYYSTKNELQKVTERLNAVLDGLCIINEKTCGLKRRGE